MKKIILLVLTLVLTLTLFACGGNDNDASKNYNSNVPTEGLTDNAYATLDGITLTEKQLYNKMRANGYSLFVVELTRKLLSQKGYSVSEEDIIEKINSSCYGTNDVESLKLEDKEKAEQIFLDNLFLTGIDVTDIYDQKVKDYFTVDVLEDMYAKEVLTNKMAQGEKITDEDGNEVDNEYFYSDEDYEDLFEEYFNAEASQEIIILPFYTLNDAFAAIIAASGTVTNGKIDNPSEQLFKDIYTSIYAELPTSFAMTDEDLAKYDSSLVQFVSTLAEGEGTSRPAEFGEYKFLVWKISEKATYDASTLSEEKKNEYKEKLFDSLLTADFVSSSITELLNDKELKIFDPTFDAMFTQNYDQHVRLEAKDWRDEYKGLVAELGNVKFTVSELYAALEDSLGMSIASSYLTDKALLKEVENGNIKISEDDVKAYKAEYDKAVKAFNNGENTNYPKELGEENFKLLYFGSSNEEEIIDSYKAQLAWNESFAEYGEEYFNALVKFGQNYADNYYNLKIKNVLIYVDTNMDGQLDNPDTYKETLSDTQKTAFDNAVVEIAQKFVTEVHYLADNKIAKSLEEAVTFVGKQYARDGEVYSDGDGSTWNKYKKFNINIKVEGTTSYSSSTTNVYQEFLDGVKALYNKLTDKAEAYVPTSSEITSIDDFSKTVYGYHLLTSFGYTKMTSAATSSSSYSKVSVYYDPTTATIKNALDKNGNIIYGDTSSTKQVVITNPDGTTTEYTYKYVEEKVTDEQTGEETTTSKTVDKDGNEVTNGWKIKSSTSSSTTYYYLYDANDVRIYDGSHIGADGNALTIDATGTDNYANANQYRVYIADQSKLYSLTKTFIGYFYSSFNTRYTNANYQGIVLSNKYLGSNVTWKDASMNEEFAKFVEIQKRICDNYDDYSSTASNTFAGWWDLLD